MDDRLEGLHHDAHFLCDFFGPDVYAPDRGVARNHNVSVEA